MRFKVDPEIRFPPREFDFKFAKRHAVPLEFDEVLGIVILDGKVQVILGNIEFTSEVRGVPLWRSILMCLAAIRARRHD